MTPDAERPPITGAAVPDDDHASHLTGSHSIPRVWRGTTNVRIDPAARRALDELGARVAALEARPCVRACSPSECGCVEGRPAQPHPEQRNNRAGEADGHGNYVREYLRAVQYVDGVEVLR